MSSDDNDKTAPPVRKTAIERPGGRTSEVTDKIFAATMALLEEGGISAMTFQRVAKRAGVGRATLYRRWPDPTFLIADAIAATAAHRVKIVDTGSFHGDLVALLGEIGRFIDSPTGRAAIVAGLTGRQKPEFTALAASLWEQRQRDVAPIFERAKERGQLDQEVDPDVWFAMAAGALYFRMIVMAQPIDDEWIATVLGSLTD